MQVGEYLGPAMAHRLQGFGRGRHHQIAGQHGIGLLGVYAHLVQALGQVGQAHKAQHRATLLRKAHEVQHAGALAFQVRGHGHDGTHRDHAGAANAGHQQIVGRAPDMDCRQRQGLQTGLKARTAGRQRTLFAPQRDAADTDEAGAKALGAGIVLVAAGLVDAALAPMRRLVRQHGDAIALHRAVAAALAHGLIDEQAQVRVHQFTLFAAPALLGGAGLLVDQHGDAGHLAQAALHRVELVAVVEFGVGGETRANRCVLGDVVADDHDALHAFGLDLARNRVDADHAVHRLAAGHGHRVVEQDLVGQRGLGGHGLAYRQVARVVVSAVAQVLEHVGRAREARMRHPVHALATHLYQAGGAAVHPVGHEVAANAGARRRAFGHLGAGVVRAAGAEIGHALDVVAVIAEQCRRREIAHMLQVVVEHAMVREMPRQPVRNQLDQARRAQFAQRGHEGRAVAVLLADDGGPGSGWRVVELLAQLGLDHRALFLDHQNLFQPGGKVLHPGAFQRKTQAHLVQAHASALKIAGIDFQPAQHLHQIVMRLATGDDAHARRRCRDHQAVHAVDLGKGCDRAQLVCQPGFDLQRGQIGPAVVQAVGRRLVAGGGAHRVGIGPGTYSGIDSIQINRGAAFHHFRQCSQADPGAAKARQRIAVQPELQVFRDTGWLQHRHAPGHHGLVALVRHRRGHAAVVITGHHQHAAMRRAAVGVAVLERVSSAVHARALAVPHGKHAFNRAFRVGFHALRAQHLGRSQFFVDGGDEADAGFGEALAGLPDRLVQHAQRRAAVATDKALGVQALRRIAPGLHQHQPHQGLGTGQEHRALLGPQVVGQRVVGAGDGGGVCRQVHGVYFSSLFGE